MKIQTVPSKGPDGRTVYTVTVIDGDHTSSRIFQSKEDAERFAASELARLLQNGKYA
jgi:hypothetical protein